MDAYASAYLCIMPHLSIAITVSINKPRNVLHIPYQIG
jgi:hypothetical protein